MTCLDASAVLALLLGEKGQDIVANAIGVGAIISAANLAEVVTILVRGGSTPAEAETDVTALPISVVDVDKALAIDAGALYAQTRRLGLSLGDRLCLALAKREGLPALTADRHWREIPALTGIDVRLIR